MPMSNVSTTPDAPSVKDLRETADEVLFEACRQGDERAFRVLVERHAALVRRLANNVVRDEQDAEDVAQDTFVSAWRNRHGWKPEAKFTTWLYRIAVNKAIDRYRTRKATPEAPEVITRLADATVQTAGTPDQHQSLEHRQVSKGLAAALDALPASQSTALKLFYFDELEVAKIAKAMLTSEQSVRALLKRGRQTLKSRLQRQKNFSVDGYSGISLDARRARS